jgi:hypothetical protein
MTNRVSCSGQNDKRLCPAEIINGSGAVTISSLHLTSAENEKGQKFNKNDFIGVFSN